MAKTRDYMDYLDDQIEIAPANSQEEYQAAETIAEVLRDHDLETTIEEFDAHPSSTLIGPILVFVLFASLLIAGLTEGAIRIICILLAAATAGLPLASHFMGTNFFENFGPAARSQNVVAVHRATGDKVVKGARPIVIVAHYDLPRASALRRGALARYNTSLRMATIPCYMVIAVSVFFQILLFLPSVIRTFMWIVGLIAMCPLLLLAVVDIIDRFSPCTLGSNDNKSSLAALLAIANKVRPMPDRVDEDFEGPERKPVRRRMVDEELEPAAPRRIEVVEEVKGVRHGAEVLSALGILPPSCEIVYQEPRVKVVEQDPVAVPAIDEQVDDVAATEFEPESTNVPEEEKDGGSVTGDDRYDENFDVTEVQDEASLSDESDDSVDVDIDDSRDEDEYDEEYIDYDEDEGESYDEEDWDEGVGGATGVRTWFTERIASLREFFSKNRGADIDIDRGEDRRSDADERDEYDEWIDSTEDGEKDYQDAEILEDEVYEDEPYEGDYEDEPYEDDSYDDEAYDDEDTYEEFEEEEFEEYTDETEDEVATDEAEPVDIDEQQNEDASEAESPAASLRKAISASLPDIESVPAIDLADEEEPQEETVAEDVLEAAEEDQEPDSIGAPDVSHDIEDTLDAEAADAEAAYIEAAEDTPAEEEANIEEDEPSDELVDEYDAYDDEDSYGDDEAYDEYAYDDGDLAEFDDVEDREEYAEYDDDDEGYDDEYPEDSEAYEEGYEEEYPVEEKAGIVARIAQFFSKIRSVPASEEPYDLFEDYYEDSDETADDEPYEEYEEAEEAEEYEEYEGYEEDQDDAYEDEEEGNLHLVSSEYDTENPYLADVDDDLEDFDDYEIADEEYYEDEYDGVEYEGEEYDGVEYEEELEEELIDDIEVYEDDEYFEEDEYLEDEETDSQEGSYEDGFVDEELVFEDEIDYEEESEVPVEPLPDPNILHFDREQDDDVLPRDTTGLDMITDSYDLYTGEISRVSRREKPMPLDDPSWGVSTYQPQSPAINIARRAALFDIPDPSAETVDPFEDYDDEYDEYEEEDVVEAGSGASYYYVDEGGDYDEPDSYEMPSNYEVAPSEPAEPEPDDVAPEVEDTLGHPGFWGDSKPTSWKGGATVRSDLRDGDADEPLVIDADDLQDAILELGDDFLVAHDIWFVATGASEVNHAGIKAFIETHRRDIRGAFLINLDSIGAGALSVLVREGLHAPRRADRRLVRMITGIAQDLHIPLDTAMYNFDERESATSMRSRVRSVTIAGLDENNLPAYSHTMDDVPNNVDPRQVSDVVKLITELIRRS